MTKRPNLKSIPGGDPVAAASPASTRPMFRDDVDQPAELAASLRPPAIVLEDPPEPSAAELAVGETTKAGPLSKAQSIHKRVTRMGPAVHAEQVARVTRIGTVTRTEMVPRSELGDDDPIHQLAQVLRPPAQPAQGSRQMPNLRLPAPKGSRPPTTVQRVERPSEPAITAPPPRREPTSEPAITPPPPRREPASEPAITPPPPRREPTSEPAITAPRREPASEPAITPPAPRRERPSEPTIAAAPRRERPSEPTIAAAPRRERPSEPAIRSERSAIVTATPVEPPDLFADENPLAPIDPDEPIRTEARSWGGRIVIPSPDFQAIPRTPIPRTPNPRKPAAKPAAIPPTSKVSRPTAPVDRRQRSAGESLARLLYFISGALLAAAIAVYGGRLWKQRHAGDPSQSTDASDASDSTDPAAARPAAAPPPAAALTMPAGRLELSADRRSLTRLAGSSAQWNAPLPAAAEALSVTGPIVVGEQAAGKPADGDNHAIVAIDLESGRQRFVWSPPLGERWASQRPVAIGSCLVTVTLHPLKTAVRCLDLDTGVQRWLAQLPGDHDCTQALVGVPSGVIVPCSGWTAVIDDHSGAFSVISGAVGLVSDQPPTLLRTAGRLVTMPWSEAKHRFTQTGDVSYGASNLAASSAVLYKDRLVLRAVDSSDAVALIVPPTGAAIPIAPPAFRLADATPLVHRCGGDGSPRFQLLELMPRIGASFDPSTVADRALALLDVETGALTWISGKVTGLKRGHQGRGDASLEPMVCKQGHYFVPLELPGTDKPAQVLWVVDAETGKTDAAIALDAGVDANLSELAADQIADDHLLAATAKGVVELAWRTPGHGTHDARALLRQALGTLP